MTDVFFEQILVKKLTKAQSIIKFLFITVAILTSMVLLFYGFMLIGTLLAPLCIILMFVVIFGSIWYVKRMYQEYEYALTNGDFDIDRIIGKAKRERIITINCREIEEVGVYDKQTAESFKQRDFDAKVLSANLMDEGLYYIVVTHSTAGRVLIVIEPNERIISGLKRFIPRMVQKDVFSGN